MPVKNFPNTRPRGFAGQIESGGDSRSLINSAPQTAQVSTLTVGGSFSAGNTYEFTIDGVSFEYEAVSGDTNNTGVATAIKNLINAEPLVNGGVIATSSAAVVTITSRSAGRAFVIADVDYTGGTLAAATSTANDEADAIPFGRLVIDNGEGKARVAAAAAMTARSVQFTPTVVNSALYEIMVGYDGKTYRVAYTADGSATAQEIVEGLKTAADATLPAALTTTEDNSVLVITAATAGDAFEAGPSSNLTAAWTAGSNLAELARGVTAIDHSYPRDSAGDDGGYPPNSVMTVKRSGRIHVATEDTVSTSSDVYVRVTANGSLDAIGGFRGTSNTGCLKLPRGKARWVTGTSGGTAIVQVDFD